MVYPLHLVDPESAADRPLIEKSLEHWIGFEGALQGYSFTGASAMSSWLGRRDAAVSLLNQFLDRYVKPNTMYLEAGPVIETPLAAAAAIHEIVLQSWTVEPFGSCIRVFPAVPDAWQDVAFHKLLAEGAFEVSASRRRGRTEWIRITSLAGNPCRVRTGWEGPVHAAGTRTFATKTLVDHNGRPLLSIDLRKGESVLLTQGADVRAVVEPVAPQPGRLNFYGSAKSIPVPAGSDGSFVLGAREARRHGARLLYQKGVTKDSIGAWTEAKEFVSWAIDAKMAGNFRVVAEYAATGGTNAYAVELSPAVPAGKPAARLAAAKKPTGSWDAFGEQDMGVLRIPEAGRWVVAVRSADGAPPYLNLHAVRLTPVNEP
jgi:hypothetical protein